MSDPDTIRIYNQRAADYAALTDDHNADDPYLAAFLAMLPAKARVLDLGCGPGASAAAMARAGCVVEACDASSEMVALAAQHPGVTAWQATFDKIEGADRYDGIWANFSLLHAPRTALPNHLAALHKALKSGGVFHIAMKLGTGEGPDAIGRYYTYYTQDALEAHLQDAGFTITDRAFGRSEGLDGTMADWIMVRAHG